MLSGCSETPDESKVVVYNNTNEPISGSVELIDISDSTTFLSETFNISAEDHVEIGLSFPEVEPEINVKAAGMTKSGEFDPGATRPMALLINVNRDSIEYDSAVP